MTCRLMFPEWAATPVAAELDRLLQGTAPRFVIREIEHRGPTGARGRLDIGGTVFRRAGHPAGVVVVTQDVTERVVTEQSARRAEKLAALGTLAAGLAHELNNPIGIISSRIEVVLTEAEAQAVPPRAAR